MAINNLAATTSAVRPAVHRPFFRLRDLRHDWPIHLFVVFGLLVALIPILLMLSISFKSMGQFVTRPLTVTLPFHTENYVIAFRVLRLSLLNSIWLTAVNVALSLALASISAYVFARFTFPGRELLYWLILGLLFIPGILTFATNYVITARLGMVNTFWALIIPYVAGSQIFQIVVLRSFFAGIENEIIEAAKVDGAGILTVFWSIVLPMSRPILATLAVMRAIDAWNEWLWPMINIFKYELRPMALQVFYLSSDIGAHVGQQMAGFAIASIPLIILFAFASKQFVEGLTSGAMRF